MHKTLISSFTAGFVLSAGLVSCSPEKKIRDVYQAPPPVIQSSQTRLDLKSWDGQRKKQFELQDSLDFTASAPARIQIRAQCRSGGDNWYAATFFSGVAQVYIWQVLPEEVLTQELDKKPVECALELNLFNSAGSNHIFALSSVPVVEQRPPLVRVAHENSENIAGPLLRITPPQMQDVRIRYANSANAAAQLFCQDMKLKALPFEQVLDLSHFDYASPELRSERSALVLHERPVQICRALIIQQGQKAALSDLIQIVLPRAPLIFQKTKDPLRDLKNAYTIQLALDLMITGQKTALGEWNLINTENVRRYLRFSKRGFSVNIDVTYAIDGGRSRNVARATFNRPAVTLVPVATPFARIRETNQNLIVAVNPREALGVQAYFTATMKCAVPMSYKTLTLSKFEPLTVEEVSEDGELISSFTIAPETISLAPEDYYLHFDPSLNVDGKCSWY